jgi:protein TonB
VASLLLLIALLALSTQSTSQPKSAPRSHHIICTPETLKPIKTVQPIYPPKAIKQKIEGRVLLELTVEKTGVVSEVSVIKGNPALAQAAIAAAKQWRYQPYLLNDQPVELSIRFAVDFSLSGRKR